MCVLPRPPTGVGPFILPKVVIVAVAGIRGSGLWCIPCGIAFSFVLALAFGLAFALGLNMGLLFGKLSLPTRG